MRPCILVFVAALPICSAYAAVQEPTFVDLHGQLAVKGTQLVDAHGEPIVLRGMSFGWHIWWPQYCHVYSLIAYGNQRVLADCWFCVENSRCFVHGQSGYRSHHR